MGPRSHCVAAAAVWTCAAAAAASVGLATGLHSTNHGPGAAPAPESDPGRPQLTADLPTYLATSDLLWSWNATGGGDLDPLAPVAWFQAAYLGNGLVGCSVTAVPGPDNGTNALRVDVGRTDVWSCSNRQPLGYLTLAPAKPSAAFAAVTMRLHLVNATLAVRVGFQDSLGDVDLQLAVNAADPTGAPRNATRA